MNLVDSRSLRLVDSSYFQHAASAAYISLMMVLVSIIATGCLIRGIAKGHVRETLMSSLYQLDVGKHAADDVLQHLQTLAGNDHQLDDRSLIVAQKDQRWFMALCLTGSCRRLSDSVQFVDIDDDRWLGVGVHLRGMGTYFIGYDLAPMLARVQIAPLIAGLLLFLMLVFGLLYSLRNSRINLARIDGVLDYMRKFPNGGAAISQARPCKDEIDRLGIEVHQNLQLIHRLLNEITNLSHHVAHELRTPLTRMQNHIVDIIDSADGEMADELQQLLDESNHIQNLFSALMRLGEIETGRCQLSRQSLSVEALLVDLADYYEPLAETHGCELVMADVAGLAVHADKTMLFQALANLLENAFKYAPGKPIELFAERGRGCVGNGVADSGPGIAKTDHAQAQQRFQRLDSSPLAAQGHGLGLALVKAIAERHDGQVVMTDNQPGLRISLRLPT